MRNDGESVFSRENAQRELEKSGEDSVSLEWWIGGKLSFNYTRSLQHKHTDFATASTLLVQVPSVQVISTVRYFKTYMFQLCVPTWSKVIIFYCHCFLWLKFMVKQCELQFLVLESECLSCSAWYDFRYPHKFALA